MAQRAGLECWTFVYYGRTVLWDLTNGFDKLSNVTYAKLVGIVRTELHAPLPNGFIRNDDPSLSQQIFDVSEAQREPMV